MRRLTYVVNGKEITSYRQARELQPTGTLDTRLTEIIERVKVKPETLAKRRVYFSRLKAERLARA